MAQFPQGATHIDSRCNAGERRVFHQLKRCLEDDYIVWHNVPIGPKARQPDFVVLSPRWGILLLEVKDWKRGTLVNANRDTVELRTERGPVTDANPIRQARDYAMELVQLMQRDPDLVHAGDPFRGKLMFPYGWGVVFSNLRKMDVGEDESFSTVFPAHQTLLRDDLDDTVAADAFQMRLWGMFTVTYPYTLSIPQRDRIRWHLFPELRMPTQVRLDLDAPDSASAFSPAVLPDLMAVMDLQQEQTARTLGSGHRVIHGAAGSGKTMILVYRAQVLAAATQPGRPILVLCFNRTLAGRIETLLRDRGVDERVQVRTFHSWCEDLVRTYQISLPVGVARKAYDEYTEALGRAVERAVETGLVPGGQYTAVLIDEAHDFEEAWLRIVSRMVDPNTESLLVLYDDAQSIYQRQRRKFSLSSVGIKAVGRTSILKLNYRNTAEVLALAAHCARSLLAREDAVATDEDSVQQVLPASAGRRGPMPVLVAARSAREEAEVIAERVANGLASGLSPSDCAVLCRFKHLMPPIEDELRRRGIPVQSMEKKTPRQFDWRLSSVKLLTLHSAKGLEFPLVLLAGLQALPYKDQPFDEEMRLVYVGMTRATRELVLTAHAVSPMVDHVRNALAEVAGHFVAVD
jgi:hypothetical protein